MWSHRPAAADSHQQFDLINSATERFCDIETCVFREQPHHMTDEYAQRHRAALRAADAISHGQSVKRDEAGTLAANFETAATAVALHDDDWLAQVLREIAALWNRGAYIRPLGKTAGYSCTC